MDFCESSTLVQTQEKIKTQPRIAAVLYKNPVVLDGITIMLPQEMSEPERNISFWYSTRMKITKFGQCCLLIEVEGKRILTDPGRFSTSQNNVTDIDIILITHEHADHMHSESLQTVLANNPQATVITNSSVGKLLDELQISHNIVEGRAVAQDTEIAIEAFDGEHVEIIDDYGLVQNTGYFIHNELFYPGDAYTNPGKPVPILALPVAGPWCKASEAIRYAKEIKPDQAFPVHDAVLSEDGVALVHGLFTAQLEAAGISFTPVKNDETIEM